MNKIALSVSLLFTSMLATSATALRILPWDSQVAERKLAVAWGKKVVEMPYLHPAARSNPIDIPAESEGLRLVATDKLDEEGKPLFIPLKIAESIKNPLAILMPDKESPIGLKAIIINDDQASFDWGTIRLFNITNRDLAIGLEKKGIKVPKGWKPVDVKLGGKTRNFEAFFFVKENLKKPFYTAVWEHRSDMRQMVFLLPSENDALGPVEVKFVNEVNIKDKAQ